MKEKALTLQQFKEMDGLAISNFGLPIELMMENAGLHLSKLVLKYIKNKTDRIYFGIGNGNNGGGGLVASRRLQAWGFQTYLHIPYEITKELPKKQLERSLKYGALIEKPSEIDIWVDAYLGFSQQLPLSGALINPIREANQLDCHRISLDIPTGLSEGDKDERFDAHAIVTMAAPKTVLQNLHTHPDIYIADLGIPKSIYDDFNIAQPNFLREQLLKID